MYKQQIKTILICLCLIFIMTGCKFLPNIGKKTPATVPNTENPETNNQGTTEKTGNLSVSEKLAAQTKIKKFNNLDELKGFLESLGTSPSYGGYALKNNVMEEMAVDAAAVQSGVAAKSLSAPASMRDNGETASPQATAAAGGGKADYSKTNIQVEGVDEADIIKSDGEYIYAVAKNILFIIKATPAEKAEIVSRIEFKSRPEELYINGNILAVYGPDYSIGQNEIYKTFKRRNNFSFFKTYDITDKANPKQSRDLQVEGSISDSRMIGDYVYLVTNNYQYYIMDDEPVLPRMMENGQVLAEKCADGVKCFTPDIYYFDLPYNNYNFTSVTAVNLKNGSEQINSDVYLLSGSQNLFVSQKSIYITYTKYISEYELQIEAMKEIIYPRLSQSDRDKIAKIEAADNFILTADEKKSKITQIIERFGTNLSQEEQTKLENEIQANLKKKYEDISKELEKTVIHKIAINGKEMEYKTFGEVTGSVLNQFSMDESGDYFRIATTKNSSWLSIENAEQKSYNNMYVLDDNLKVVGSLENIAPGEKIYSVRFMGNRAYMVTFVQTDPLFAIDLTDPKAPKILGELKIPGYSSYLHPYDENTLIGIGKDTKTNKWGGVTNGGIKLSLFDVSDISAPKEVDTEIIGDAGSDSVALYDHKAFLFSKDKNLLAIPATINEDGLLNTSRLTFSGVVVYDIDKTGFKLKGKIDHSDGGQPASSDSWRGYDYYDNNVLRNLYIGETLYSFSNNYLKMNALSDLKETGKLILK